MILSFLNRDGTVNVSTIYLKVLLRSDSNVPNRSAFLIVCMNVHRPIHQRPFVTWKAQKRSATLKRSATVNGQELSNCIWSTVRNHAQASKAKEYFQIKFLIDIFKKSAVTCVKYDWLMYFMFWISLSIFLNNTRLYLIFNFGQIRCLL